MLITVCLTGTRGDVQPSLAVAKGLRAAGFEIRVASMPNYREFVESHGFEFHSVGIDFLEAMQWDSSTKAVESGVDARQFLAGVYEGMDPYLDDLTRQTLAACEGSDIIFGSGLSFPDAYNVGEKLNIPVINATLQPMYPTRFLPVGFGGIKRTDQLSNIMAWMRLGLAAKKITRPGFQRQRTQILGLPKASFGAPFMTSVKRGDLTLYAFSPSVVPRPRDWPAGIDVTGYWFLPDEDPGWEPPPDLADFIYSGSKPVYVGFGSIVSRHAEKNLEIVRSALRKAGRRGVLHTGWGGLAAEPGPLDDDCYVVGSTPHSWLLPKMAATIHHGGAGTTASALKAGVPTLIVPFYGDHYFWGSRVSHLGVGPEPIPHVELNASNLAAAITAMTTDEGMRSRAAELGMRIASEDGVGRAVSRIVERFGAAG